MKLVKKIFSGFKSLFNKKTIIIVIALFLVIIIMALFKGKLLILFTFLLGVFLSPLLHGYLNLFSDKKLKETQKELAQYKNNQTITTDIHLDKISLILEMNMLEAELTINKFYDLFMMKDKKNDDYMIAPNEKKAKYRFIGFYRAVIKIKYGVDFRNVWYKKDENEKIIYFYGLNSTITSKELKSFGFQNSFIAEKNTFGLWNIKKDHPLLANFTGKFETQFNNSLDEELAKYNFIKITSDKQLKQIIEKIIVPHDWVVHFVDKKDENFLPIGKNNMLFLNKN